MLAAALWRCGASWHDASCRKWGSLAILWIGNPAHLLSDDRHYGHGNGYTCGRSSCSARDWGNSWAGSALCRANLRCLDESCSFPWSCIDELDMDGTMDLSCGSDDRSCRGSLRLSLVARSQPATSLRAW